MAGLGGWHFVILIGVLVLLFGARKLPEMARSIGQSARVFKGEMKGMKADEQQPDVAQVPLPLAPAPAPEPVVEQVVATVTQPVAVVEHAPRRSDVAS